MQKRIIYDRIEGIFNQKDEVMNNLIELQDVNLIRNGKTLLKNLNWQVKETECWAILGLNGAGKSTLLKLLMSEYWASSGQITVLGTRFGEGGIPELRRRIGIVSSFISERLPEHLLTEQIVLTGQYKSSILYAAYGEVELNWARDMLTSIGASSLIGRKYRELSQGEKQTVLIARSLMDQPDLIIFDEASSGLDLFAREKLLRHIHQIKQLDHAPTMIYVTHHAEEITKDITHVLLLKDGQIVDQGPKETILRPDVLSQFYQVPVSLIDLGDGRLFVKPDIKHSEQSE